MELVIMTIHKQSAREITGDQVVAWVVCALTMRLCPTAVPLNTATSRTVGNLIRPVFNTFRPKKERGLITKENEET